MKEEGVARAHQASSLQGNNMRVRHKATHAMFCVETLMARCLVICLNRIQHSWYPPNRYRWLIAVRRQPLDLWLCLSTNNGNALAKVAKVDNMSERASNNDNKIHTYDTATSAAMKATMLIRHRASSLGTGPSFSSSKTHQQTTLGILYCVDVVEAKKLDYSLTLHGGSCLMVC